MVPTLLIQGIPPICTNRLFPLSVSVESPAVRDPSRPACAPAQAERSPLTIKNYRSDLRAFAAWFEATNGDPFKPAKITPTDLREYKPWMVTPCGFKPKRVNRKLAAWGRTPQKGETSHRND